MNLILSRKDLSIVIANALDYFDTALYGFLAPVLASIFFPSYDPIAQLILTYSALSSSSFTRPLGAFVFGMIAQRFGPTVGLSYSLVGMAISSVLMGLLPGFSNMGWIAPLFLVMVRMLRGFFAAGEGTIAKLYVFEGKKIEHALSVSYFYQSAAMLGMVLASIAATLVITFPEKDILWRLCFCLGGITGLIGYYLRRNVLAYQKNPSLICSKKTTNRLKNRTIKETLFLSSFKTIWKNRDNVLRVSLVTTFSYMTYVIPFVFMNSFIPLVTDISLQTMMSLNTALIIFDMVFIPIIGRQVQNFEARYIMLVAAIILASTVIPLFNGLLGSSLVYVTGVRVWIVFWGIVFLCPMNFWLKKLFDPQEQYLLVGIGTAFGAGILGRFTPVICFALWYKTEITFFPALYLAIMTLLVAFAIRTAKVLPKKEFLINNTPCSLHSA